MLLLRDGKTRTFKGETIYELRSQKLVLKLNGFDEIFCPSPSLREREETERQTERGREIERE